MNKIPKKIHYCWFGSNPLPTLAIKCIESWKKFCPDYEIIEWNENNFDVNCNLYVRQAYESKKWAFVSDVARLYVLYHYGGIYMDTDVELIKTLDGFLENEAFSGFEDSNHILTGIMACRKKNELFEEFLSYYDARNFIKEDGSLDITTNVIIITNTMKTYNFIGNDTYQVIRGYALYPTEYFCPLDYQTRKMKITKNTHAIHHFNGSWLSEEQKQEQRIQINCKKFFGTKLGSYIYLLKKEGGIAFFKKVYKKITTKNTKEF